jgi:hypothetical protein
VQSNGLGYEDFQMLGLITHDEQLPLG